MPPWNSSEESLCCRTVGLGTDTDWESCTHKCDVAFPMSSILCIPAVQPWIPAPFPGYQTHTETIAEPEVMRNREPISDGPFRARIDLQRAGGVDPARLERSLGLRVRRVGRGRYQVTGGKEPHWVDLYTARMPRCDCGDHLWRERVCKHILAVMLREGDERVIAAIGDLVAGLREALSPPRRRRSGRGH